MSPMKRPAERRDAHLAGTLTIDHLAKRWRTSRKVVRRLLGLQRLNFLEINGQLRVPCDEVERYERKSKQD